MKSRISLVHLGLLVALLLVACGSPPPNSLPTQLPTIAPTSAPTATPEPTLPPPTPTIEPPPTLPPAEATITTEGKQCSYDGPQSIPAAMTFTINWYVNSTDYSQYGLYVIIVGDGKTKADLVTAIKLEGAPPSWLTQAGSFDAEPNSSQQVILKTAEGPLLGPLYFVCFFSESGPFQVIGPMEVD